MNNSILEQSCQACEGGIAPLTSEQAQEYLKELDEWEINKSNTLISKTYTFKNHYEVMGFVNAIAWVSHCENHHPELVVNYKTCLVSYTTHAIDGLSLNDFICAKKVARLIV